MNTLSINRRQVLGAAAITAFTGLLLTRGTSVLLGTATAPLALLDGTLADEDRARARQLLAPLEPRILGLDLLWEWRADLGPKAARGDPIVAITRWDKAIMLSGLAREAGLTIRQARITRAVFRTEIG